jgi:hypothetical protein
MSLFGRKPRTLGEVVRRVKAGEQKFDPSLRQFLDSFYVNRASRQQAIEARPDAIDAVHDRLCRGSRRASCANVRIADTGVERDSR